MHVKSQSQSSSSKPTFIRVPQEDNSILSNTFNFIKSFFNPGEKSEVESKKEFIPKKDEICNINKTDEKIEVTNVDKDKDIFLKRKKERNIKKTKKNN